MQAVSDEQLIQWIAAGDQSCLGTLFERHHRALFNYCLQMTRNPALSEDMVQETFLKMLRSAASFRGEGSFRGWMFQIARNLVYDHLRRARHTEPLSDENQQTQESPVVGPEGEFDSQVRGRTLERALAALPVPAREVIWLGRFQLDSFEELGRTLDCSAATARVRMHRAVKQLKELVGQLEQEASRA